jgi:hypothetical protein
MTYVPKLALELQSFSTVEEMNDHMNLHYYSIKNNITKSQDSIFHLIKKYACVVAGVCWLKQDSLAKFAEVSTKTVERGLKFLKDLGVLKIYHTKRSNGLNGNCYYVLQPYQKELLIDSEEIISVEENVGAGEGLKDYDTTGLESTPSKEKLLRSSVKALESSFKTKNEEEINNNARVLSNRYSINNYKEHVPTKLVSKEDFQILVQHLIKKQFSVKAARKMITHVIKTFPSKAPLLIMSANERAYSKLQRRLKYEEPILSLVDYFLTLVTAELQQGDNLMIECNVQNESSVPSMELIRG